jgi:DNA-binding HxlR family transcriptional regulator
MEPSRLATLKSKQKRGKSEGGRKGRFEASVDQNGVKPRQISSVIRALDVLSDPWSFLTLREAFFGVRRFDGLQRNLEIARNVLSSRLSRLVSEGLLERRLYVARPPRFEYRLTDQGRDFFPPIVGLMTWGDRWRPRRSGPPLELTHKDCGKALTPCVVCAACQHPLSPFDVEFEIGPGAGMETDFHAPTTRRRDSEQNWLKGRPCSVASTLKVIGDRWSLRILRECFVGVRKFKDFQSNLAIARNILSDRLDLLCKEKILERRRYQDRPPRFEYVLTSAGYDLYGSLVLFMAWGDKWRSPPEGVPLKLRHKLCGHEATPVLVCGNCGGSVRTDNVTYHMHYKFDGHKPATKTKAVARSKATAHKRKAIARASRKVAEQRLLRETSKD